MLHLNVVSKIWSLQIGFRGQNIRIVCDNITRLGRGQAACFSNSFNKLFNMSPVKTRRTVNGKDNYLTFKRSTGQVIPNENVESKSNFQSLMHLRKKQAERSVLFSLKKENIPFVLAACEKFGAIKESYSYAEKTDVSLSSARQPFVGPGLHEKNDTCLLVEFSEEMACKSLLSNCQFKNISAALPTFSRLLKFEKKSEEKSPSVNIDVNEDNFSGSDLGKRSSLSDIMLNIFLMERITELNTRLRFFFCTLIKDSISGLFPHCDVLPFGSSVNGIGKQGCDLDVMIRLYPEEASSRGELYFLNKTYDIRALQQKAVLCLGDYFRTFFPGVVSLQKIVHARMPILKMKHKILNMDCDVSINNMSAVMMSDVIHFCGEIDFRVRPLLYSVKKWAKNAEITYGAPGVWITNFGLTVLVIYFLQSRPVPILPPFNDAFVILGEDGTPDFKLKYLKSVDEFQNSASLNKEALAVLLKEFLKFLVTYPFQDSIISLMGANSQSRNQGPNLWVQYPFEEGLNITKNVSDIRFRELRDKARVSLKYLENTLNQKVPNVRDFDIALGINNVKRIDPLISNRINVKSILEDNGKSGKKRTTRPRAS